MTDANSHPRAAQAVGESLPAYLSGRFHLVSTGIGDAGNITVNAQEVLRRADVVFGTSRLLVTFADLLGGKELHDAGHGLFMDLIRKDTPAEKADAMEADVRQIVRRAADQGKRIAVIDYGDSMIFGPQAGFIQEFSDLDPVIIPGVSSFNAANAALARDVMTGSMSRSVILAAAYDTRDDYAGTDTLQRLAQTGSTLVFFAMRSRFQQLTERLKRVLPGSTPLAVVCHAGRSEQHTVVRATLDTAVAALQGRDVPFEHLVYVGDFLAD
ncbi:SAM-dependent methyltransferase [Halomonas organivorans]|uniref:Precorrin-4 methylase n=1 Tax=Halomonas organivorans TaxID=257772 RepID=A0A7W5G4H7_9GAMM|nr:SAM-dependent methyltransferase [Halomonas organivorans]MBB3139356.1 precorrin-4 methylase [Halomonas organivorans]